MDQVYLFLPKTQVKKGRAAVALGHINRRNGAQIIAAATPNSDAGSRNAATSSVTPISRQHIFHGRWKTCWVVGFVFLCRAAGRRREKVVMRRSSVKQKTAVDPGSWIAAAAAWEYS